MHNLSSSLNRSVRGNTKALAFLHVELKLSALKVESDSRNPINVVQ